MAGSTLQLVKCEPDSFLDALNKFSDWTKSQNGELSRMKSSQLRVCFRMRPGVNWRLGDVGAWLLRDGRSPPRRSSFLHTCWMTSQVFRISYFGQRRLKKWPLLEHFSMMVGGKAMAVDGECWWQNQGAETTGNYHLSLHIEGLGVCMQAPTNHSLILSREGLILTLAILPCPQRWIS